MLENIIALIKDILTVSLWPWNPILYDNVLLKWFLRFKRKLAALFFIQGESGTTKNIVDVLFTAVTL